jgi:hypothetical protein
MRHLHRPAVFQQAQGAADVGGMVADGVGHGRADAREGGQMDHGVKHPVGKMVLANVALAELHPIWQGEFRLENVEGSDPVTGCVEVADDMSADETGRTGDENGERFGIHATALGVNLHHRPAISAIFAWFSGPVASGCAHGTENQHRQHRVDNTCARIVRVLARELIHCSVRK